MKTIVQKPLMIKKRLIVVSQSTNTLGKDTNPIILSPAIGK